VWSHFTGTECNENITEKKKKLVPFESLLRPSEKFFFFFSNPTGAPGRLDNSGGNLGEPRRKKDSNLGGSELPQNFNAKDSFPAFNH